VAIATCKEILVIPVNKAVDKKRIIRKGAEQEVANKKLFSRTGKDRQA
jgi:hypothetical protein